MGGSTREIRKERKEKDGREKKVPLAPSLPPSMEETQSVKECGKERKRRTYDGRTEWRGGIAGSCSHMGYLESFKYFHFLGSRCIYHSPI